MNIFCGKNSLPYEKYHIAKLIYSEFHISKLIGRCCSHICEGMITWEGATVLAGLFGRENLFGEVKISRCCNNMSMSIPEVTVQNQLFGRCASWFRKTLERQKERVWLRFDASVYAITESWCLKAMSLLSYDM